jgi:arylsulfatase A-like enzyme
VSTLRALALAALGAALACGAPEPPREPPHGIVLVVVDTLRADGLSVYGNPRPTSPVIDALANEGVRFDAAVSHAPWTFPGFVGLLSGQYPSPRALGPTNGLARSLVEPLRAAGFATAAFTEGAYVSRHFGMDLGFERFVELEGATVIPHPDRVPGNGSAAETFDAAIAWLREHAAARQFFLMVHTYEVHIPYRHRELASGPPPEWLGPRYEQQNSLAIRKGLLHVSERDRDYIRALYDSGVAEVDRQMGRLLAALDETGVAPRTLVALTADHGEDLGARDERFVGWHGHRLYDEVMHIPLLLRDPRFDWPVRRVVTQVRLVDVMPTLLELAGAELPPDLDGRSLVPLMLGREHEPREVLLDWVRLPPWESLHPHDVAFSDGRWKLILGPPHRPSGDRALELYDLEHDPGERDNLVEARMAERERLMQRLNAARAAVTGVEGGAPDIEPEVPEAVRERLRALGYVD